MKARRLLTYSLVTIAIVINAFPLVMSFTNKKLVSAAVNNANHLQTTAKIHLDSYQQGWFNSTATIHIANKPPVKLKIDNTPLHLVNDHVYFGTKASGHLSALDNKLQGMLHLYIPYHSPATAILEQGTLQVPNAGKIYLNKVELTLKKRINTFNLATLSQNLRLYINANAPHLSVDMSEQGNKEKADIKNVKLLINRDGLFSEDNTLSVDSITFNKDKQLEGSILGFRAQIINHQQGTLAKGHLLITTKSIKALNQQANNLSIKTSMNNVNVVAYQHMLNTIAAIKGDQARKAWSNLNDIVLHQLLSNQLSFGANISVDLPKGNINTNITVHWPSYNAQKATIHKAIAKMEILANATVPTDYLDLYQEFFLMSNNKISRDLSAKDLNSEQNIASLISQWKKQGFITKNNKENTYSTHLKATVKDIVLNNIKLDDFNKAYLFYCLHKYYSAFPLFLSASQHGNSEADYYLAIMYKQGLGVKKDYEQAAYYLKQAINKDNKDAKTLATVLLLSKNPSEVIPKKSKAPN